MSGSRHTLEGRFVAALEEYLRRGGEAALLSAYDLGRDAMNEGLGIHDVASLLHRAVWRSCARDTGRSGPGRRRRTEEFILESLSPFEMAYRSVREANEMLYRLNDLLEAEIRRMAHELHDHSGQLLASVHLSLDQLARDVGPEGRERLQRVRRHLEEIQEQMRSISHELRPTVLDDLGLVPALRFLGSRVSQRTGLDVRLEGDLEERQAPRVETALYRIVQEALTNVAKHAGATMAVVKVERSDEWLRCSVEDDGAGFEPARRAREGSSAGLGLLGIRERLANLGGTLTLESSPGRGTRLEAALPLGHPLPSLTREPKRAARAEVGGPSPSTAKGTRIRRPPIRDRAAT